MSATVGLEQAGAIWLGGGGGYVACDWWEWGNCSWWAGVYGELRLSARTHLRCVRMTGDFINS